MGELYRAHGCAASYRAESQAPPLRSPYKEYSDGAIADWSHDDGVYRFIALR
jgi:hypothetical protein